MDIKYENIITKEEFLTIDEKTKDSLISIASVEAKRYKSKNPIYSSLGIEKEHAREIANSGFCANFNNIEKELMATSIAYEDEQIIKLLINSNILFEHLDGLCNSLGILKKEYLKNKNSKLKEKEVFKKILSVLDKICFIISFTSKLQDQYLIINKLIYISTFRKDLYLKLQQEKTKKIQ